MSNYDGPEIFEVNEPSYAGYLRRSISQFGLENLFVIKLEMEQIYR